MVPPDIPNPLSNSPLYPMLLMSLMAQNYTPVTKTCFKSEYDYIIVGAGSAGSVVASRLSENPNVTVLLLEAGPSPPPITEVPALGPFLRASYLNWNISSLPQKNVNNREIPMTLGKTIGGSSVLNDMMNVRGNRKNFESWAESGAAGWDYYNVLPYFKRLETFLAHEQFNPFYHGYQGPVTIQNQAYEPVAKPAARETAKQKGFPFVDYNAEKQNGFSEVTLTTRNGRRCSTGKAYLVPADQKKNLRIVANAFVTKIIIKGERATEVEVEFQGVTRRVKARREIIVSAGGIHTPQILMLSGIGPKEELSRLQIPIVVDLPVGKNFHDHPLSILPFTLSDEILSFEEELVKPSSIHEYTKYGTGLLTTSGGTLYMAFLTNDGIPTSDAVPDIQLFLLSSSYDPKLKEKPVVVCGVILLSPESRGSVKLNSADPHDPPLVDPNYYGNPEDLVKTIAGMKFCDNFLSSEFFQLFGAQRYEDTECNQYADNENDYYACIIKKTTSSTFHFVGTARMGHPHDWTTVVDPELRVKGVQGLRVVDASVMPTVTSGNTNIPTIMIAEKAADIIKRSA